MDYKRILACTAVVIAIGAALPASAATLIAPDTAVASSTASDVFGGSTPAGATIDGSGLDPVTGLHVLYNPFAGTHWTGNEAQASIIWGFNAPVNLAGVHIWNHDSYPALGGLLEVFGAGGSLLHSSILSLTAPPFVATGFASEFFAFDAVGVEEVKFTMENAVYNLSAFRGLAEVRFLTAATPPPPPPPPGGVAPVPLPASGLLLLAGLSGLLVARRHRG